MSRHDRGKLIEGLVLLAAAVLIIAILSLSPMAAVLAALGVVFAPVIMGIALLICGYRP